MQARDQVHTRITAPATDLDRRRNVPMAHALSLVVPGQPLRQGLERILLAKRGALIVVGDGPEVLSVCTGGFLLDAEFTPQRLAELAKLDGAIVLSSDASRIARANVHLVPDPSVVTTETGTRHRTAERMARSLDIPVISVSASMGVVTVYRNDSKHPLQPSSAIHERVSHALATLQRFRQRFDFAITALSALEMEDTVTVGDVAAVLQPGELVMRIAHEIENDLDQLGAEGGMLRLQLGELTDGVEALMRLVVRDYAQIGSDDGEADASVAEERGLGKLSSLTMEELGSAECIGEALGLSAATRDFDSSLEPRGYRLLHRLPRFPETLVERIVEHFSGLQTIMRATVRDLEEVDGVGQARARSLKDDLSRHAEASILDRYA